jgi:hypothetical protein
MQAGTMINNHSTVIKDNSRSLMVRYLIEEREKGGKKKAVYLFRAIGELSAC